MSADGDLSRRELNAALLRHGWRSMGFNGYWVREGLSCSEHNLRGSNRAKLAWFIQRGRERDAEKAAAKAKATLRDAAPALLELVQDALRSMRASSALDLSREILEARLAKLLGTEEAGQ